MDARLPWRYPFRMIDRMVDCEPRRRIRTEKHVTSNDPWVTAAGMPGVLLLEGMSQSAALLFRLTYPEVGPATLPMLGFLRAKLHGSAAAGETVIFEVRSQKMTPRGGVFEAEARGGESKLAEAELAFSEASTGEDR